MDDDKIFDEFERNRIAFFRFLRRKFFDQLNFQNDAFRNVSVAFGDFRNFDSFGSFFRGEDGRGVNSRIEQHARAQNGGDKFFHWRTPLPREENF